MASDVIKLNRRGLIIKWSKAFLIIACFLICSIPHAEAGRSISLPFIDGLDDNNYSDLVWVANGATHAWQSSGCWSEGCAKFTPPDTVGGGSNGTYAGLGQFNGFNTTRINIRFLVYLGSTYLSTATSTAGGLIDKFIIVEPSHSMAGLNADNDLSHFGFGPTNSGASYRYHDIYADWRDYAVPYAKFKWGDSGAYIGEWVCVEYELDNVAQTTTIYVWTQDEVWSGITTSDANDATSTTYIDIIGGYYNRIHTNQDVNTYMLIDELKIDSSYIGPPAGFILEPDVTAPSAPSGLSVN